ncbi:MAG: rod shape-determining protein MreC [Prevotella sp.]|nr:rod shape-determining protein MreC [Prevotella sp.]
MRNLLEFLAKYYNWFLFVILEIVSCLLLFQYNNYQGSVWINSANVVNGKLLELSSSIEAFFSMSKANEQLTLRNFYLERQVGQLRRLYTEATGDTLTPDAGQMELLERYKLVPAKVVGSTLDRQDNLMTIDKGSADGIEPDMGVVSGLGVVGVTFLVGDHYSVVMPVINTKTRISCVIRGRGYFGYLQWDGKESGIAYLEDVPRHARFKKGDWVETNGYSSIFPPGVMVGKIVQTYNSRDGLSYKLKVQLATDFGNLRDVSIITDKELIERARLLETARDSLRQMRRE